MLTPDALLREARRQRQKIIEAGPVLEICPLDWDGGIVRHLHVSKRPSWGLGAEVRSISIASLASWKLEGAMLDAIYNSLIERAKDGRFVALVPDLPGITISGDTEEEVIRTLSRTALQCVREMGINGRRVPEARAIDELPRGREEQKARRLLLIIG